MTPLKATLLDDDRFSLLAIPYGGPIKGRDLDGEWFSKRTDIKPDWFSERPVLWHHGQDRTMKDSVLGKALDLREEEDGWWVDVWLKHGERRVGLIKRLAEKAPIFGSSSALPSLVRKAATGEILVWPYIEQTLSTSPQNTYSVLRSAKAALGHFDSADIAVSGPIRELLAEVEALSDLDLTSLRGEGAAKAGRVLSARNESALREALDRLSAVLAQLQKDEPDAGKRIERSLNAH